MPIPLTPVHTVCFRLAYAKRDAAVAEANAQVHVDLAPVYADLGMDPAVPYRVVGTASTPVVLVGDESLPEAVP